MTKEFNYQASETQSATRAMSESKMRGGNDS